jgi:outer membrane lipase/esterase
MKRIKWVLGASLAAMLLASCGGGGGTTSGNPVGFTSIASFGDSLSDAGTHAVGSVAAIGGGRYTINSGNPAAPTKIWLDHLSAQLGLPAPCAAVTGLNPTSTFALLPGGGASAPTNKAGCTNHAQGGSRVTLPIGPANQALFPASQTGVVGQLTYPIKDQISQYLTRNGGSFGGKVLVTVLGGGNDAFMQSSVATAAAAVVDGPTAAAFTNTAIGIGGWTMDQVNAVLGGGGQTAVVAGLTANMNKAGAELANLVKNEMVAKGAKYVLVINMPDLSSTPNGLENPAGAPVANAMAQAFNAGLTAGLAGVSGVTIADSYNTSRDQFRNAAAYGLTNVTNRACSTVFSATNILSGAAIGCNVGNTISGDVSKYLFADDVHPTPYGHQLLAQFAAKVLATAGWL